MSASASRCDVILENGAYLRGVRLRDLPATLERHESPVRDCLKITGWYRLPLLGMVLRNYWAKRNGANL